MKIFYVCQFHLVDGVQNVLSEASNIASSLLGAPFLLFWVVELITPQTLYKFGLLNAKL